MTTKRQFEDASLAIKLASYSVSQSQKSELFLEVKRLAIAIYNASIVEGMNCRSNEAVESLRFFLESGNGSLNSAMGKLSDEQRNEINEILQSI